MNFTAKEKTPVHIESYKDAFKHAKDREEEVMRANRLSFTNRLGSLAPGDPTHVF